MESILDPFCLPDFSPPPVMRLREAVRKRNYPAAYNILNSLEEPLSGQEAGQCLAEALGCSPGLFASIHGACAPGEYAGKLLWESETTSCFAEARGTLLLLAAAMNKPEIVKYLLRRGYDVNGASYASIQAMSTIMPPYYKGLDCYRILSSLNLGHNVSNQYGEKVLTGQLEFDQANCSPLAAAIACGSMESVSLLLNWPGVKVQEDDSVCQVLLECCAGSSELACWGRPWLWEQLGLGNSGYFEREALLSRFRLTEETYLRECSAREFGEWLRKTEIPPEEYAAMAERLSNGNERQYLQKLRHLYRFRPEACEGTDVADNLLFHFLNVVRETQPHQDLLRLWKTLSGEVRDISALSYVPTCFQNRMQALLDLLGEGGSLRADAESPFFRHLNANELREMLRRVTFFRSWGKGISALGMELVRRQSLPLLREAEKRGALDGEPRDELLAYARAVNAAPAFRAALLSLRLPGEPRRSPTLRTGALLWLSSWAERSESERRAWENTAWEQPLSPEETRDRVAARFTLSDEFTLLFGSTQRYFTLEREETVDGLRIRELFAAACCGRNPELLRALLPYCPLTTNLSLRLPHVWHLQGSPLCLAAAAGRTEQVELLLEAGAAVNDGPECRSWCNEDSDFFAPPVRPHLSQLVTPLHMALRQGHRETAELLRARGGECWPPLPGD